MSSRHDAARRYCVLCGKSLAGSYYAVGNRDGKEMVACLSCHTAIFWLEKVEWRLGLSSPGGRPVVIDAVHYVIGPENARGSRGFGGRKHVIRLRDTGEIIESTNLWLQGDVPLVFRDLLPDTADFVETA